MHLKDIIYHNDTSERCGKSFPVQGPRIYSAERDRQMRFGVAEHYKNGCLDTINGCLYKDRHA
jgi:hypothetical protein